jgi:23S rRNA pseudouridine955/2504/2580 synthase
MKNTKVVTITNKESGQKLYQFLERYLNKQVPRSALMKWIRTGQVRVDGKRAKPFERIFEGQRVRIPPHKINNFTQLSDSSEKNPFLLKKIYEDDKLLVLYKPPSLATQPGKNLKDSVYHRLKACYPIHVPYLVHRLDKETSGLLLVAKTYTYLRYLQNLLAQGKIKKIYLAWVNGNTYWSNWRRIEDSFEEYRDGKRRQVKAVSFVKTLENREDKSLVAVSLVTGRKHQIRIQLSLRNHPIIGEKKYAYLPSSQGLLLHAYLLKWDDKTFSCLPPWRGKFKVSKVTLT